MRHVLDHARKGETLFIQGRPWASNLDWLTKESPRKDSCQLCGENWFEKGVLGINSYDGDSFVSQSRFDAYATRMMTLQKLGMFNTCWEALIKQLQDCRTELQYFEL